MLVRRLPRRPVRRARQPGSCRRARPGGARARAVTAPGDRGAGQRGGLQVATGGGPRELLVRHAALPGDPRGSRVGVPPRIGPVPQVARGPAGGHRAGVDRLRAAADGAAADAAGLRRHPRPHIGVRMVGRRRERTARAGRVDQPVCRDAAAARRLVGVGRLGGVRPGSAAMGAGRGPALSRGDDARGARNRQPLLPRRGCRHRGRRCRRPAHPASPPHGCGAAGPVRPVNPSDRRRGRVRGSGAVRRRR